MNRRLDFIQKILKRLLAIFEKIVDNNDTVVIIEHNLDVIKCADYIIDLGPNGGDDGGRGDCDWNTGRSSKSRKNLLQAII